MRTSVVVLGLMAGAGAVCAAQEVPSAEQLLNDLACGSCHQGIPVESDIREKTPDLTDAGLRFAPDYVFNFLLYPVRIRQNIGYSRMPNFRLDERESLALTLYLQQQLPPGATAPSFPVQPAFEEVKAAHPDVSADLGADIFVAMNCVACHKHSRVEQWEVKSAPNLGFEGARVSGEWLTEFLRHPTPVRPFGFYPGTGSRHPDFLLTAQEVTVLRDYLLGRQDGFNYPMLSVAAAGDSVSTEMVERLIEAFGPDPLIPFSEDKAQDLLRDKLPCLGCHRLGDDGGRIGPDLSAMKTRLRHGFAVQMIRDAARILPEAVMPTVPMPDKTSDLIATYLWDQTLPRAELQYFSPVDIQPQLFLDRERGERLYLQHCAACHGPGGDGDGYNADYLPKPPTAHSDSVYMSTRPDDTLFDGIYAGGYILNKSNRMPPWGFTLEREDIWQLVAYIRHLCRCEGPAWSRR